MANISQIKLPNGNTYNLKDNGALQLTGGQVTGPVTFGDSVSVDELTTGDLVVNGAGSFTNNLQVNTINGIAVGDSPKFTDTVTTISTTGSGNGIANITVNNGVITATKDNFLTNDSEYIRGNQFTGGTNGFTIRDQAGGEYTVTITPSITETDPTVPAWAKASSKPSYSLTEISGTDDLRAIEGLTGTTGLLKKTAANTWTLDTNTYLTSYTETDPTVPSWAKASTKPTYTASEVGAMSTSHAANGITSSDISNWNGKANQSDIVVEAGIGNYSIQATFAASGAECEASGNYSVALGYNSIASGSSSVALGGRLSGQTYGNRATGAGSTAIGGGSSLASGDYAIAMGYQNIASGQISFAVGDSVETSGSRTAAFGAHTIANHNSQLVFGRYNIADPSEAESTSKGNYVEIVGNGTSSARSNARTLDWNGNEVLAGKLTLGANPTAAMDAVTKQYMENQGYLTLATLPIYDGTVV